MDKFFERYEELVIQNHHLKHDLKDVQRELIELRAEVHDLKNQLCCCQQKLDSAKDKIQDLKEEVKPDMEVVNAAAEQAYLRAISRSPEDRKQTSDFTEAVRETKSLTKCSLKAAKDAVELAKKNYELKKAESASVDAGANTQNFPLGIIPPGLTPEAFSAMIRKM